MELTILFFLAEYQSKSDLTGKLAMSSLSLSDRDVSRSTGIVSQVNTTLQKQLELSNVHTAQLQVSNDWG